MFLPEPEYAFPRVTLPATRWAYARTTYSYPGSLRVKNCGSRVSVRGRTPISVSVLPAEWARPFFAHRVENLQTYLSFSSSFVFILVFCFGKRTDFRSADFLEFFPSRIYRSGCHSSGAALSRPTGKFQIL
jgi:hypothetical protein